MIVVQEGVGGHTVETMIGVAGGETAIETIDGGGTDLEVEIVVGEVEVDLVERETIIIHHLIEGERMIEDAMKKYRIEEEAFLNRKTEVIDR